MATICAREVVQNALFSLFEGFVGPHFCCFVSENLPLGLQMLLKALQKHLPEEGACAAFRLLF